MPLVTVMPPSRASALAMAHVFADGHPVAVAQRGGHEPGCVVHPQRTAISVSTETTELCRAAAMADTSISSLPESVSELAAGSHEGP